MIKFLFLFWGLIFRAVAYLTNILVGIYLALLVQTEDKDWGGLLSIALLGFMLAFMSWYFLKKADEVNNGPVKNAIEKTPEK